MAVGDEITTIETWTAEVKPGAQAELPVGGGWTIHGAALTETGMVRVVATRITRARERSKDRGPY